MYAYDINYQQPIGFSDIGIPIKKYGDLMTILSLW